MITKKIINADALDARTDGNKIEVIKKPPCFHAVRNNTHVVYRKLTDDGIVNIDDNGVKVPLSHFLANFNSFNSVDDFRIDENFKSGTFFFVGTNGLRKISSLEMPCDFFLTCSETDEIMKFNKGDVLLTSGSGLNTALNKEEFRKSYMSENELSQFVEPDVRIIRSKNNDYSLSI